MTLKDVVMLYMLKNPEIAVVCVAVKYIVRVQEIDNEHNFQYLRMTARAFVTSTFTTVQLKLNSHPISS